MTFCNRLIQSNFLTNEDKRELLNVNFPYYRTHSKDGNNILLFYCLHLIPCCSIRINNEYYYYIK